MFFEAMMTSGVSESRAKLMYAGVYFGGPRWSETAEANNQLAAGGTTILFKVNHSAFEEGMLDVVENDGESARSILMRGRWGNSQQTTLHLGGLQEILAREDPTLAEIERAIDTAAQVASPLCLTDEVTNPRRVVG
jgi:hypothetical protein